MNREQKVENKNTANEYRYFSESNLVGVNTLFVLVYTNQDDNAKRFNVKKYYLAKAQSKIISLSSIEKTFMTKQLFQCKTIQRN